MSVGNVTLAMGDAETARGYIRRCHEIYEELTAADPENSLATRFLAMSYSELGRVNEALGDPVAIDFYKKSVELGENLAAADPRNAYVKDTLSRSYLALGHFLRKSEGMEAATGAYDHFIKIGEQQVADDPANRQRQTRLFSRYITVADVSFQAKQFEHAATLYQRALVLLRRVDSIVPLNADDKAWIEKLERRINECKQSKESSERSGS